MNEQEMVYLAPSSPQMKNNWFIRVLLYQTWGHPQEYDSQKVTLGPDPDKRQCSFQIDDVKLPGDTRCNAGNNNTKKRIAPY